MKDKCPKCNNFCWFYSPVLSSFTILLLISEGAKSRIIKVLQMQNYKFRHIYSVKNILFMTENIIFSHIDYIFLSCFNIFYR